ncbi:MAG: hypothetical protein B6242_08070 [Anaerolineaceae bacterium 4572_78]|nr:MAG: hypothetical protein B6242_08070 [Anaerolineaceae bacterium 4572_78]
MKKHFRTPSDYELFLYTITEQFSYVLRSSLVFIRRGSTLARIRGELFFGHDIRLVVSERVIFDTLQLVIDWYGYEVWQGNKKLYWYDSQPHPNDPTLASTHPHHKHVPPNIRRNRIPAPNMSFEYPNLPALIAEIEEFIKVIES